MKKEAQFTTPILFLIFNRPDLTEVVFKRIREVQPKYLFVAADGPREGVEGDQIKCKQAKEIVLNSVDWECEVKTLFREENFGCGKAVSEAITWFFEHVKLGIILEDDCLPDLSFFGFCESMLKTYSNNISILFISGSNFQMGKIRGDGDYYFSRFPNTWGWATWRDRWRSFNFNIAIDEKCVSNLLSKIDHGKSKKLWLRRMMEIQNVRRNVWDYQWFYQLIISDSYTIVPNKNLVKNIGIGHPDFTNTKSFSKFYENIETSSISEPFREPSNIEVDRDADRYHFKKFFNSKTTFINRIRNFAYVIIPESLYSRVKSLFGR